MKLFEPATIFAAAALAAGAAMVMIPTGASAQTATNLNCNGCVDNKDIANKAVTNQKIKPGTIKNKNLAPDAIAGGQTNGGPFSGVNVGAAQSIMLLSLDPPGKGYAIVTASGTFEFDGNDTVSCEITKGVGISVDSTNAFGASGSAATVGVNIKPFSGSRVFPVGSGTTFFRLVCEGGGNVDVRRVFMNAIFVPNDYSGQN